MEIAGKNWVREMYEERHRKMEQLRLSLTLMGGRWRRLL